MTGWSAAAIVIGVVLWRRDRQLARQASEPVSERGQFDDRLSEMMEFAPDVVLLVDRDGLIVRANQQAERILGYDREELVGKPCDLIIGDAFRGEVGRRREHTGIERDVLTKDGRAVPAEIRLNPLSANDLDITVVAIRDISERQREEEARQRLAAIIESTSDAVMATTPEGTITSWNAAATKLYGHEAASAIGRPFTLILPRDHAKSEMALLREVATGRPVEPRETVHMRRDGGMVDVAVTLSPVRDAAGDAVGVSSIARDISERKRFEAQLRYMADRDPLTGLYNRRRFDRELEQELARARRSGRAGALLAIDLDHFKFVNDTLGHSVGDDLIVRVAELLRSRLRATDVLGRLGGDEFAAVLADVDVDEAMFVATSVVKAMREEALVLGYERRVTASIGIALFDQDGSSTPEELMVQADIAMYDAKEAGRDRATVYSNESVRLMQMTDRLTWVERIREALEHQQFTLHAQPILSLGHDLRPRHELLIRMLGQDGDLVLPASFLQVAERFDLVQEIDRWVLSEAVRMLAEHQRAGSDLRLQVNVSARSVGDLDVAQIVSDELSQHGVDGRGLCIEITETAAVVNVERARRIAHDLNELGVKLALDDFGVGFASFYYLKHLTFDFLKIDGEFVKSLVASPTDQLIVRSIVEIARGMGKQTIAEFVGDAETVSLLRSYGVDYAQGFYVATPSPLETVDLAVLPAFRP